MASISSRVTFHCANGLKHLPLSLKMKPFVEYSVVVNGIHTEPLGRTHAHRKGGSDPIWGVVVDIDIPKAALNQGVEGHLLCKIKHSGLFSDRRIGEVRVPLQQLLATGKRVSYPVVVVSSSGKTKKKGDLIISHEVGVGAPIVDVTTPTPAAAIEDHDSGNNGGGSVHEAPKGMKVEAHLQSFLDNIDSDLSGGIERC